MSEEQQEQVKEQIGLGEMLRQAREKAGLTLDQIADQLHLKATIIEGLEKEQFDEGISVTFTKGYLKLYAKQVNLPEEEVLTAFERVNTKKGKETTKLQSFSRRVSKQANDDKLMLVTYFIVAVVVALVVLWWFQQGRETTSSLLSESPVFAASAETPEEPKPTLVTLDAANPEQSQNGMPTEQAVRQSLSENTAQATDLAVTASTTEAEPAIDETSPGDALNEDTPEEVQSDPQSVEETLAQAPASTAMDEAVEAVESLVQDMSATVTDADSVQLVFEFADDCWMNLVDGTGEAIAYGTKAKGRVMPVSGVPPFEVILGAPESVQISYNGQPIDMTQFPAGRTARFSLPLSNSAS